MQETVPRYLRESRIQRDKELSEQDVIEDQVVIALRIQAGGDRIDPKIVAGLVMLREKDQQQKDDECGKGSGQKQPLCGLAYGKIFHIHGSNYIKFRSNMLIY